MGGCGGGDGVRAGILDGVTGDSTAVNPVFTYTKAGKETVRLVVSDGRGDSASATVTIQPRKKETRTPWASAA